MNIQIVKNVYVNKKICTNASRHCLIKLRSQLLRLVL